MSIREVPKDHLKEHSGVTLTTTEALSLPEYKDPLKFWTQHPSPSENVLIDLTVLSDGEFEPPGNQRWAGPFTGRPSLIRQLAPAVQAACIGNSKKTAMSYLTILRLWWRLLDAVEKEAEAAGQAMDRVEDVRHLTQIHCDFAHRRGVSANDFYAFLRVVKPTLKALQAPALYWKAPEPRKPLRRLPIEEQTKAIRIALKQDWEAVRRRSILADRIRTPGFEAKTGEEANLLKHWHAFERAQHATGKAWPTTEEIAQANGYKTLESMRTNTGLTLAPMRSLSFPDRMDVEAAFHLCLANTGWNPAVLFSLDASQPFLRTHPKDPDRYILVGVKARAAGKEQIVSGLWKTHAGPGAIIRTCLERTAPLREQLQETLAAERRLYAQMVQEGTSPKALERQVAKVHSLEEGCRSVWLYIESRGDIGWLNSSGTNNIVLDGKSASYMAILIDRLNRLRATRGETPIPPVTASDFRDIFALYVWRISGGNILAVMRALNHAHLRTTQRYTENNILDEERDQQARTFLDHLFSELGKGRLDITILAHLQRHGAVTKKMERNLADYRALQRSRISVACKDPFSPPPEMRADSNKSRVCNLQRCLLCKTHAVILPESLPGVAMRVEELEATRTAVPAGDWFKSQLPDELQNGLSVLKLFPVDAVRVERERWAKAIADGTHHVPGLNLASTERITA